MDTESLALRNFRSLLDHAKAELARSNGWRDEIAVERSADDLDESLQAYEREFAIRNHDRQTLTLRHIEAALRRIDRGEFGVCIHCEQEINVKRLHAVPWTPLCLSCQETADRNEARAFGPGRSMLDAA